MVPSFHSYWAIYINLRLMLAGKSTLQTYGRRKFEVSLKKREGRGAKWRVVEGSWSVFQWQIMQFGWNPQWKTVDSSCSASLVQMTVMADGFCWLRLRQVEIEDVPCLSWTWMLMIFAAGCCGLEEGAKSRSILPCMFIWGFPQMGVPQNGLFIRENHGKSIYKWMIAGGYPYFRAPPFLCVLWSIRISSWEEKDHPTLNHWCPFSG